MVRSALIIGIGGFLGTVARYLIGRYFQVGLSSAFPWGTLVVNLLGCLIIGVIYGVTEKGDYLSPDVRLFLTVGICGGFTTFSSLANDAFLLIRQEEWIRFVLYSGISFTVGLFAVYFGRLVVKMV